MAKQNLWRWFWGRLEFSIFPDCQHFDSKYFSLLLTLVSFSSTDFFEPKAGGSDLVASSPLPLASQYNNTKSKVQLMRPSAFTFVKCFCKVLCLVFRAGNREMSSITESKWKQRDSAGEGHGYSLKNCLENSIDRGAWRAIAHGVEKGQIGLSN